MKVFVCIACFCLNLLFYPAIYAKTNSEIQTQTKNLTFDLGQASLSVNDISVKLSEQTLDLEDLKNFLHTLQTLRTSAKNNVNLIKGQIEIINNLLTESQIDPKTLNKDSEYNEILNKKDTFTNELSDTLLFIYNIEGNITNVKNEIKKYTTTSILHKNNPTWSLFYLNPSQIIKKIDFIKIYNKSGLKAFNTKLRIASIFFALLFVLLFTIFSFKKLLAIKEEHINKTFFKFLRISKSCLFTFIFLSSLSIFLFAFKFTSILPENNFIHSTLIALSIYLFVVATFKFFSLNSNDFNFIIYKKITLGKALFFRTSWLFNIFLIGYIVKKAFVRQSLPIEFIDFCQSTYLITLTLTISSIALLVAKYINKNNENTKLELFSKYFIYFITFIFLFTEVIGYHKLAVFIFVNIFLTIILTCVATLLLFFANKNTFQIKYLTNFKKTSSLLLHNFLRVKPRKKIFEIIILKIVLNLIIFYFYILYLFKVWSATNTYIDKYEQMFLEGINIAGMEIVLYKIITATIVFCFVNLLGRLLSAHIIRTSKPDRTTSTQITITSLINYIFFAVGLLLALLALGVNLTSLTVIAGALSVGIGLGMQDIVNNFVSGIILILEKRIKPGDRILINETEGYVKKILIRATHIVTPAKEDVFIPNSALIMNKVTNYMYADNLVKICCKVGVAYGSNVELVKEVLLKVAHKHPRVLTSDENAPSALFKNFGDSSLEFHLWCVIEDVNLKYRIGSELNFEIEKAFKENNIIIAFPQIDVHIKDSGLSSKNIKNQKNT